MNRGVWQAVAAYIIWGMSPLFWKTLHEIPALQLVSHWIVWAFLLLMSVVYLTGKSRALRDTLRMPKTMAIYTIAAALLGVNWIAYVWGVNAGFVVEASLGYFINPLLSVVLGVVFFGERLRRVQWFAVALAAAGVAYLTYDYGRLPWIALALAATFAIYGLVKKKATLGSVEGLTLETGILFIPGLAVVVLAERAGTGSLIGAEPWMLVALLGTGLITIVPLLLFASSVRRIPLVWIGLLQYIAPTLQFLLGVFVFKEAVSAHTLIGFSAVWAALALLAGEAFTRKMTAAPVIAE